MQGRAIQHKKDAVLAEPTASLSHMPLSSLPHANFHSIFPTPQPAVHGLSILGCSITLHSLLLTTHSHWLIGTRWNQLSSVPYPRRRRICTSDHVTEVSKKHLQLPMAKGFACESDGGHGTLLSSSGAHHLHSMRSRTTYLSRVPAAHCIS